MSSSTFSDLLHALDPRPEVRFREFERICRWYLLNAPEYRSLNMQGDEFHPEWNYLITPRSD